MKTVSFKIVVCLILLLNGTSFIIITTCSAYVPAVIRQRWKDVGYSMDDALKTIEACAEEAGENNITDELYYAVRFVDRNAHKIYSDPKKKTKLWEQSKGSWELRLAYDDNRSSEFYPYPDFRDFAMAFTMVEDGYFGKGIAQGPYMCYVAMGGPAKFNATTRQLFMIYEDFFINGRAMPNWDLSYFMRGYATNWYFDKRTRPPLAFTLIAASKKALVVRGNKTGGMAIFRRIPKDMRPAAYGSDRGKIPVDDKEIGTVKKP